jgi:alpha-glucosidase
MEEFEEKGNEIKDSENIKEIVEETIQHLNNPVLDLKPIVKKYLTQVQTVIKEGNKFFFSDGEARVEVRVVSDEIIRVRLAPHGVFLDEFSYAVPVVDQKVSIFHMDEHEDFYAISTNTITCKEERLPYLLYGEPEPDDHE